jgi:sigma-B regulation protein RsbU (phosphoserine phosphatase)
MGHIEIMVKRKIDKIKNVFKLYTMGLNHNEIELLLKKDTIDTFSYLRKKTNFAGKQQPPRSIKFFLNVAKEIFISFVMQLTPARRLVYGIGVLAFIFGLLKIDMLAIIVSVLIFNFLLALELVDKLTTRDELEIAREIQLSLQPVDIPESDLLSFSTFSEPAKIVGGDFFDVIQLSDNRIISIVGDVSDKGIPAALYAAYTQSMFQSLSETKTSPGQIMGSLNDLIGKRLRDGDFITIVIALFDLKENSVTITRAGHNWPLYYSSETKNISELKPQGSCIGMVENPQFKEKLEELKIYLKKDDFILLYTDGITEAFDSKKQMFNISNLKSAINESVYKSSNDIIDHINLKLRTFTDTDELQDDATMVAVKVKQTS